MTQTPRRPPAYNAGVPWTSSHQLMTPRVGGTQFRYRDPTGIQWWSDGHALFRGYAPGYLCLRAGLPVDVPTEPLMLAIVRDHTGARIDGPTLKLSWLVYPRAKTDNAPFLSSQRQRRG